MQQIALRKEIRIKPTRKVAPKATSKVIIISMLNPPLFYRKAAHKKTYYYL